jgi:hypothetical protein
MANIGMASETVRVSLDSWVLVMGKVTDREEVGGGNHPGRYTRAELFDLLTNVAKEGIAGPSSKKHDGEDGDACQVHSHRCTRLDGVGATNLVVSLET